MSSETTTVWKCEFCRRKQKLSGTDKPEGWGYAKLSVYYNPSESQWMAGQMLLICHGCIMLRVQSFRNNLTCHQWGDWLQQQLAEPKRDEGK